MEKTTMDTLTHRERQILHLISFEFTSKEIANQLFISTHTVWTYRKNLHEKLNVRNTAGMIRAGFELGILSLNKQSNQ